MHFMLDYFLTIAIIKGVDSEVNLQTKTIDHEKTRRNSRFTSGQPKTPG